MPFIKYINGTLPPLYIQWRSFEYMKRASNVLEYDKIFRNIFENTKTITDVTSKMPENEDIVEIVTDEVFNDSSEFRIAFVVNVHIYAKDNFDAMETFTELQW